MQLLESDPEKPQGLSKAVGQAVAKVGVSFVREAPGGSALVELLDENTLVSQGGEWFAYVAKKLTNKDDIRLAQSPVEE